MWVEIKQDGGHELSIDFCCLHHVWMVREVRDGKDVGAVDGSEVFLEAICQIHGGSIVNAVIFGKHCK